MIGRREVGAAGPAVAPAPPRFGVLSGVAAAARLPSDLLVGLGYLVRELPFLVQDVRSLVNDLARLADESDRAALTDLVAGLSRAAGPEGALTHLLESAGDLAKARAEVEREQT